MKIITTNMSEKVGLLPRILKRKIKFFNLFYWPNLKYYPNIFTFHISQRNYVNTFFIKTIKHESSIPENELASKAMKYNIDSDILYNSYIQYYKFKGSHHLRKRMIDNIVQEEMDYRYKTSVSIAVEKDILSEKVNIIEQQPLNETSTSNSNEYDISSSFFPLSQFQDVKTDMNTSLNIEDLKWEDDHFKNNDPQKNHKLTVKEDIDMRLTTYNQRKLKKQLMKSSSLFITKESSEKEKENTNSGIYSDSLISDLSEADEENAITLPKYGTPDPNINPSNVPCGGCGSALHCQNQGLPGYVPSELFKNKNRRELQSALCQRCFFLQNYDMAINVKVSPEVYENALQPIINDMAAVIVVLDIMDVPCSIWPGLYELLGSKRPVFVIGNKVDLLPPDRTNPMENIKKSFVGALRKSNLWNTNIIHIALTSGKTGYGIEDLISRIQVGWGTKGNIYIVGCTNSGKSTMFNAFLRSDMCQTQASDIIQRATASHWPGTTLNLLKFPLLRPTGDRIFRRMTRLKMMQIKKNESLPKSGISKDYTKATFTGHIGQTFLYDHTHSEERDSFSMSGNIGNSSRIKVSHLGINEKSNNFHDAKWLYDTPGTVQPDQLLGLLTHGELMKVLPNSIIVPRTYSLKGGNTLFLGGLARIDILYAEDVAIRLTVFSSSELPVTVVETINASSVYRKYMGTELFSVPYGPKSRLDRWPGLKPTNIKLLNNEIKGVSCCDITLSSAGFIAVTGTEAREIDLRAWTPGARGVYVRSPAMLPLAVRLRGNRIRGTPSFLPHDVYVPYMKVRVD